MTKQDVAIELKKQTVKELSGILAIGNVAGRSQATTKAQKIEMILVQCYNYEPESEPISQPKTKAQRSPKVTRATLAEKASVHGWEVIRSDDFIVIKDGFRGTELGRAKTIGTIAKKLEKLIDDKFMSEYHATSRAREATYGTNCYAGLRY